MAKNKGRPTCAEDGCYLFAISTTDYCKKHSREQGLIDKEIKYTIKLPDGTKFNTKNKEESDFVKSQLTEYDMLDLTNVAVSQNLSSLILCLVERNRISDTLQDNTNARDDQALRKSLNDMNKDIERLHNALHISLANLNNQDSVLQKIINKTRQFAKYRAENKHFYQGYFICPDCKKEYIVEGNFENFQRKWAVNLKDVKALIKTNPKKAIKELDEITKYWEKMLDPDIFVKMMEHDMRKEYSYL